jgi:hypothetical protein
MTMNEVSYYNIRAQHYFKLALETVDPSLKTAYLAIANDMKGKVATADQNRKVVLIDGVAIDTSNDVPHKLQPSAAESP